MSIFIFITLLTLLIITSILALRQRQERLALQSLLDRVMHHQSVCFHSAEEDPLAARPPCHRGDRPISRATAGRR